ncbi:MAG: hypothetical protein HYS75_07215 [Nitrosopumilales archaeon]|nr:hypothetical protein [Nitrosopumilales archaeon]
MTQVNHVKFATLFAMTILLATSITLQSIPAYATHNTPSSRICGDKICDANNGDDAEAEREQMRQQVKSGTAPEEEPEVPVEEEPVEAETPVPGETVPEMEVTPEETVDHGWKTATGTITSEPIQLVALHGPLAEGEDAGQAIWTPDGTTKFALTFIDPETAMGSWMFTGNALAVHTLNTEPFTVSYSVSYMENEMSDTVKTETITSMVDPGVGHETHQLAIII